LAPPRASAATATWWGQLASTAELLLHRAACELLTGNGLNRALEAEHLALEANSELHGLARINDIEGRETVIAMFKVALAPKVTRGAVSAPSQ
jgi:hypothetical protein